MKFNAYAATFRKRASTSIALLEEIQTKKNQVMSKTILGVGVRRIRTDHGEVAFNDLLFRVFIQIQMKELQAVLSG